MNGAFKYLNKVKSKHSNVLQIPHNTWRMYVSEREKILVLVRSTMLDVTANFKRKYKLYRRGHKVTTVKLC